MINVELLKKAQASILDPRRTFDMQDWSCCIAGHIVRAHDEKLWGRTAYGKQCVTAIGVAGLDPNVAHALFTRFIGHLSRKEAALRLQALIDQGSAPGSALEPACSALEPSASSASARAENTEAVAAVEEPELVCV